MKTTIFFILTFILILIFTFCATTTEEPSDINKNIYRAGETINSAETTTNTTSSTNETTTNSQITIGIVGSYFAPAHNIRYLNIDSNNLYFTNNYAISSTQNQSAISALNLSNYNLAFSVSDKIDGNCFFQKILLYNNYLYSYFGNGYIYNISNPNNIFLESTNCIHYNHGNIKNNYLYVNLVAYNLSISPIIMNYCGSSFDDNIINNWNIFGNYLTKYIAYNLYLNVFISECTSQFASQISLPSTIYDVTIYNDKAYAICGFDGLRVIDINNAGIMQITGSVAIDGFADGKITIYNHYALITKGIYGIDVFDLSNPISPTKVAFLDTPQSAGEIITSTNTSKAYVIDGTSILFVDISALN